MNSIIKRPYRCLCDFERIYDFMVRQYSIDCRNGCRATILCRMENMPVACFQAKKYPP